MERKEYLAFFILIWMIYSAITLILVLFAQNQINLIIKSFINLLDIIFNIEFVPINFINDLLNSLIIIIIFGFLEAIVTTIVYGIYRLVKT